MFLFKIFDGLAAFKYSFNIYFLSDLKNHSWVWKWKGQKGMDYIQEQLMPPTKTWKAPRDIPALLTFFLPSHKYIYLDDPPYLHPPLIIFTNVLENLD